MLVFSCLACSFFPVVFVVACVVVGGGGVGGVGIDVAVAAYDRSGTGPSLPYRPCVRSVRVRLHGPHTVQCFLRRGTLPRPLPPSRITVGVTRRQYIYIHIYIYILNSRINSPRPPSDPTTMLRHCISCRLLLNVIQFRSRFFRYICTFLVISHVPPPHQKTNHFIRRCHPYARQATSQAVPSIMHLSTFMRLTQRFAVLRKAWCKQAMFMPGR